MPTTIECDVLVLSAKTRPHLKPLRAKLSWEKERERARDGATRRGVHVNTKSVEGPIKKKQISNLEGKTEQRLTLQIIAGA